MGHEFTLLAPFVYCPAFDNLIDSFLSVSNSFISFCELFRTSLLLNTQNLFHSSAAGPVNCLGQFPDNYGVLPLADNGGPTKTRAIGSPGSAAINAGNPTYCETVDQRGEVRGATCDVGAYEATGFADVAVSASIEPDDAPYVSNQNIIYYAEIENPLVK